MQSNARLLAASLLSLSAHVKRLWAADFEDVRIILEQQGDLKYFAISKDVQRVLARGAILFSGSALLVLAGLLATAWLLHSDKAKLERSHQEVYSALLGSSYDMELDAHQNLDAEHMPLLAQAIREEFVRLQGNNPDASFAVRSSATAEDLPDASFAGQQETFLNVVGIEDVLHKMKEVFASLYNDRAISYRVHKGFAHADVALSAGVQRMVRSDLGAAGVMFTLDTESGFPGVVFITSSYGLGETVVQGAVNPDEFYVFKETLAKGKKAIIRKSLGSKLIQMQFAW